MKVIRSQPNSRKKSEANIYEVKSEDHEAGPSPT